MANILRLKRRASGGAAGSPTTLKTTEPAFNEVDDTLYLGKGDDGAGNATSIVPIAGKGAFTDLTSTQSITGAKTFTSSPIIPTPSAGDNSTKAASTAYVTTNIATEATARATATSLLIPLTQRGAANGVATLDAGGLVPASQLPSYVDDVLEYANLAAFPGTGVAGIIYVTADTNKTYRWSGSVYVEISASPGSSDSVTEGSVNLYFTEPRVRASLLTGFSTTNSAIVASDNVLVGFNKAQGQITARLITTNNLSDLTNATTARANLVLDQVNNTSDASKPVSTAQATAIALKLSIANNLSDLQSASSARGNLGLGSMATQAASAVAITGGTIDGITLDGGTF